MTKKLYAKPFYLLLVPLFFILHTIQENYDLINLKIATRLFGTYCFITAATYGISYLFFKDHRKSSIITTLWMSFFLFYSAFHEFLKTYSPFSFFGRYVFTLPFAILMFILLFIYVKKINKRFVRFSVLLNLLFAIYIVLDLSLLTWKSSTPRKYNLSLYEFPEYKSARICDTCTKPDIYFLLFDGYAGSSSLKSKYGFDNTLDGYLNQKGFQIQPDSRANYNFTGFSLASILNMSYIKNFKNPKAATANDYVGCSYLIRNNRVTEFLEHHGYEILNYSIFDLKNKPALTEQYFLPQTEKIITERTFFNRITADIGWHLYSRLNLPVNPKNPFLKHIKNNEFFLSLLKQTATQKSRKPRFTYVHLLLPHSPFFFDRNGKKRDHKVIFHEDDYNTPASYLQYLEYTNNIMEDALDTILYNNPKAVIVLMGDHGYRLRTNDPHPLYHFNNLNAVYYPDKDYRGLYKDISGCNQFRVIFNKLFKQNFPLLKDSSIYIIDKINR
jgi:hypothetical protein